MTEEHKRLFREQQEGYAIMRRFETEALRKMTFDDRLAGFNRIMGLAPYLHQFDSRADDDNITQTWIKIRERYDAAR